MWTILRRETLEVRWGPGAELHLLDAATTETTVAGGPLIELAPTRREGRPRLYGLGGAASHTSQVHDMEPARTVDAHGSGVVLERRFPVAVQPLTLACTLRLYDDHPFVRLDMRLEHTGAAPLALQRVFAFVSGAWWGAGTLSLAGRSQELAAYKNGWQSWSYAGGLPPGRRDPRPRVPTLVTWHSPAGRRPLRPLGGPADVVSEEVALLGHSTLPVALLAGFLSADDWLGQIYLDRRAGALAAGALLDGCTLRPGATMALPPLLLALGPQRTLLPMYAAAVGREQRAGVPERTQRTPTGWCSWYYYFTKVSEADVLENLAALRAVRGVLPLDVVQIDDGYQTAVGDWTSVSERFPHGMAPLAARIRDAGFRPGLWLAPFTVAANSRLAAAHPEWLVQDELGRPASAGANWNTSLYGLDTSHPAAQAWLRALCHTLVAEWGLDYLKLDFLACAAIAGRRHDGRVSRARALRDGLALIRAAVGDDVYLLGCGCPLLPAVGLVDAMRIGPDVAPYWSARHDGLPVPLAEGHALPAMEGALRNTLERAWMYPALWTNDPDCLLVREEGSQLTLDEIRAFATAVGLTGGMVLLSDPVARLTLERLEIGSKLLPPLRERAQPLDCFAWGIPDAITVPIERPWGRWLLVGLFNRQRRVRDIEVTWPALGLAPGAYHAVEFWSGAYLGAWEDGARVRVGPHGAAALAIVPAGDEARLLATSFHIGQGAAEITRWRYDAARGEAAWHVRLGRRAAGTCTLWLPWGATPQRLASTALSASWRRGARGEIVVSAEVRDEADFTLELRREV
jgi:alpha-galactosidase